MTPNKIFYSLYCNTLYNSAIFAINNNTMKYKDINIDEYKGLYRVYEDFIYSIKYKRIVKPYINNKGLYKYVYIPLTSNTGHTRKYLLHIIILYHWVGYPPSKLYESHHKDLNNNNNHYTNLEWITRSENTIKSKNINNYKSCNNKTKLIRKDYKCKKVLLYNDNEDVIYKSIECFCTANNVTRNVFNKYVNSHLYFNGFKVRYL